MSYASFQILTTDWASKVFKYTSTYKMELILSFWGEKKFKKNQGITKVYNHKYISITSLTESSSMASNFCCNTRIICIQHSLASCNVKKDKVSNPGSEWSTKFFQNNHCLLGKKVVSFFKNIKPNKTYDLPKNKAF